MPADDDDDLSWISRPIDSYTRVDLETPEEPFLAPPLEKDRDECKVPTVEVTGSHLETFNPFGYSASFEALLQLDFVRQLLRRGPFSFADLPNRPFDGYGIYAIYYHGDLEVYRRVKSMGALLPIYLGKRGSLADEEEEAGVSIHKRLVRHRDSLEQVRLNPDADFTFRFLRLPASLIEYAESALLYKMYRPLWNFGLTGFGNQVTGTERKGQTKSRWDTFHVGRIGAGTKERRGGREQVESDLLRQIPYSEGAYNRVLRMLETPMSNQIPFPFMKAVT